MGRVLIIDDEPTITMILKEVLMDEGYEITTAINGLNGLEVLQRQLIPDIIIIDLLMPRMGGRDFIITIRSKPEFADIPILLITGAIPNPQDFPPENSYQDIIYKPFDIEDVLAKVNSIAKVHP